MQLHMFMAPLSNNYHSGYYPSNEGFMDKIKEFGNSVVEFIKKVFNAIIDFFKYKIFRMERPDENVEISGAAVKGTLSVLEDVKEIMSTPDETVPPSVKTKIIGMANGCITKLKNGMSAGKQGAKDVANVVTTKVAEVLSATQSSLLNSANAIANSSAVAKGKEMASDAWDTTKSASSKAWDSTKTASSKAWDTTKKVTNAGVDAAKHAKTEARVSLARFEGKYGNELKHKMKLVQGLFDKVGKIAAATRTKLIGEKDADTLGGKIRQWWNGKDRGIFGGGSEGAKDRTLRNIEQRGREAARDFDPATSMYLDHRFVNF